MTQVYYSRLLQILLKHRNKKLNLFTMKLPAASSGVSSISWQATGNLTLARD